MIKSQKQCEQNNNITTSDRGHSSIIIIIIIIIIKQFVTQHMSITLRKAMLMKSQLRTGHGGQ